MAIPIHFETLTKVFSFFDIEDSKNIILSGFRSAGIIQVIKKTSVFELAALDPYM